MSSCTGVLWPGRLGAGRRLAMGALGLKAPAPGFFNMELMVAMQMQSPRKNACTKTTQPLRSASVLEISLCLVDVVQGSGLHGSR